MAILQAEARPRAGDPLVAAIEVVYEERLDALCSVVAAITHDRGSARDIVHDAFALALRSRHQYRGDGDVAAWVWRIVVNAARDQRRKPKLQLVQLDEHEGSERRTVSENARLTAAIQALPERQRLAIFLRYYADLEYRQIGEVLGIATGTVSAALSAAHRRLEEQLNEVEA